MMRKTSLLITVCVLSVLMTACERQKIGDINADPGQYQGKTVSVAGRVSAFSVGVLGTGLYQIDDGTGKLYVISESRGVPSEGAYVGVKGTLLPNFTFLGKNYATVLKEKDRRLVRASD